MAAVVDHVQQKSPTSQAEVDVEENKNKETKEEKEKKEKKDNEEKIRTLEISGLKSLVEAKSKLAKIFWLILLLLSLSMFTWQLYKTIDNYINSPIVSTYTVTTVKAMDFPIVYICPTAFLSSLHSNHSPGAESDAIALKEEMGLIWDQMDFLSSGNVTDPSSGPSTSPADLSHVQPPAFSSMRKKSNRTQQGEPSVVQQRRSDLDAEEFFKNATVPLDDNVRYCEFRSFMFEKLPCANITKEVLDPKYGKCYAIDVGGRQQTVQSQALLITYNVRSQWYPKSALLSPLFNGVYLSVQQKLTVDKNGERILLAPNSYYRVDLSLQHQVFDSFDHPYKQKCVANDSYPRFDVFNVSYTEESCAYDCAAKAIRAACGCVPPADSSLFADGVLKKKAGKNGNGNGTTFCKGNNLQCIREIANNASIVSKLQSCRDACQRPCEDWRYSVRATSMQLYQPGLAGKPIHDLMYILVSFSQMEYTEFTQDDSKTIDQFIADIGGEASLWLGAGMLTLLQMPIVFFSLCGGCCKKRAKKLVNK